MYDAAILGGIGPAIQASGRGKDLVVTGGGGFAANVGLVRSKGVQDFDAGVPSRRVGWAAVDGLNRLFAGEPQVDAGIGFQAADFDHNLPKSDVAYDGNVGTDGKPLVDPVVWRR